MKTGIFGLFLLASLALPVGASPLSSASRTHAGQADLLNFAIERNDISEVKSLADADPLALNTLGYDGNTPIQTAIVEGRIDAVRLLLAKHANVNVKNSLGSAPLHQILSNNPNISLINLFLKAGADINIRDKKGRTPLELAIQQAGLTSDVVALLLTQKAIDVNARDNDGSTPLREAVITGSDSLIRLLLEHGARKDMAAAAAMGDTAFLSTHATANNISAPDFEGLTPLHWAVMRNREAAVRELLRLHEGGFHGDVRAADAKGRTPLHIAAISNKLTLLPLLIEAGADIEAVTDDGDTPLHYAAEDALEFATQLIARGANVMARNKDGRTPLFVAVTAYSYLPEESTEKVFQLLKAHGADVNAQDNEGRTPLHSIAAMKDGSDRLGASLWLLANGADVNARDSSGRTPLHLAIVSGNRKLRPILLDHGADVNAADDHGLTPLHLAVRQGEQDTVLTLLAHGANINAAARDGVMPLGEATLSGHNDLEDLLLSRKAQPDIFAAAFLNRPDAAKALLAANPGLVDAVHDGQTPLHVAASHGALSVAALLLAHGADVNAPLGNGNFPREGFTPLMLAAKTGNKALVQLLLNYSADPTVVVRGTFGNRISAVTAAKSSDIAALILAHAPAEQREMLQKAPF